MFCAQIISLSCLFNQIKVIYSDDGLVDILYYFSFLLFSKISLNISSLRVSFIGFEILGLGLETCCEFDIKLA